MRCYLAAQRLLYLAISLFMLVSCTPSPKEKKPAYTLTIATLTGPSAISMVKMMQDSMLNDSTRMQFIVKSEPNLVKPMVLQQQVDLAILPTNMASILFNKGARYRVAAIPVWGTLYLFGTDSSITSWKSLRGKHVYLMGRGMTPDVMFRFLVRKNGLDPARDLMTDYTFPTHLELGNAVAAGKAPLGVISEPMVSLAVAKNPRVRNLLSFETEWNRVFNDTVPFAQTALLVSDSLLKRHPGWLISFMQQYDSCIRWANNNPALAARLVAKYHILPDSALAAKAIPGCRLAFREAWNMRKGISNYLQVFYDFDPAITGGKIPSDEFYINPDSLK